MNDATDSRTEQTGFSCAVTDSTFEELKDSDTVQVMDWHGMGTQTEFDVFVSLKIETAESDDGRPEPKRSEPADFGGGESTGVRDL